MEELAFQNFRSVFRTGLVDPALLNAIMLSFVFAVTGGRINRECLGYQSQAIGYIRERMSSLDEATSESTIGAILLLAGVEVSKPCSLDSPGVLSCVELIFGYPGSPWDDISGSASYRSSAAAASALSNEGRLSYWRNQTGHILVSNIALLL